MSTIRTAIQVLSASACISCSAVTNDIEAAILSFPKINAREFRPDEAVASANVLVAAGKAQACAALAKVASGEAGLSSAHGSNDKVCHLCRLLFLPTNAEDQLSAPRLGVSADLPYESLKPPEWPDLPFAIVNEVPLSVNLGYIGGGLPERAETYLAYCKANGTFRKGLFPVPSSITASNALTQLFNSAAWKALKWRDEGVGWCYTLDEADAKKGLWKQIANMANETVQRTGASRSAEGANRTPSAAGSRR